MGAALKKRTRTITVEEIVTDRRESLARFMPNTDDRTVESVSSHEAELLARVAVSKAPKKGERARHDPISGPTRQRIEKAGEDVFKVFDNDGKRIFSMRDAPLDRMLSRHAIDPAEYTALQRFKHHWHHAGLTPGVGSVDPNRVFSTDPTNFSGMAKSERQAHHRQQWREACEILGHRSRIIVDNVVCAENSLEIAGYAIGWHSKPQAIAAASEILRDAGYRLAKLWGIG